MHGLQSFVSTQSEESGTLLFTLCFARTNAFNICIFESSAVSLEKCVLVFRVFITATRKLRVNGFLQGK